MIKNLLFQLFFCLQLITILAQSGDKNTAQNTVRKVRTSELQNINEVYYFNQKPYTGISIDLFDDRTKMQEINWKNGILHGSKTEYFQGGKAIRTIINFYEGKRHGPFVFYHENGKIKLQGQYHFDELDSTVNSYYDNGSPKYVHFYSKGVRSGESVTFYKNGNTEQKINLSNGKPHGQMLTYYEAGNLREESHYNMGIREGRFIRYHLTGQVAEESFYTDGFLDSTSKYWDNVFGTLMKEESYRMGKKHGCWVTYNEGGDTLSFFNYKEDVLHGPYKKYYSGVVETGDAANGKELPFDRNKSKKIYVRVLDEFGTYVNGKLHGEFKTGLYNRAAHAEGSYSNGVMVGEWKYFDENDKLVLTERYNELGELIYQKPKIRKSK